MQISANNEGLLLGVLLGFAIFVAFLHLVESVMRSLWLRAWKLALGSGALLALAILLVGWQITLHAEQGLRFSDMLAVIGAQLGAGVCLPSRWLLRRKCQWERMSAQEEWEWERTATHPSYTDPQLIRHPRRPGARRAGDTRRGR